MPDSILQVLVLLCLIALNAFFAASEIAIISLNDNKIRKMAEEGNKKANLLVKLTSNSSRFLATIQVGVTLSGFLASAVAADSFAGKITRALTFTGLSPSLINAISLTVITLLLSFLSLVFGELVPKRIAMQKFESVSFGVVYPLAFISKAAKPFIFLLTAVTNLFVRLFGFDPNADDGVVTEEEIRMLVDVGEEKGVIDESEKDMINNIFEFNDTTVEEIMTHRTEIFAVDVRDPLDEVIKISMGNGYSRIPVYDEDIDTVKGIIYIKDLLKYIGGNIPKHTTLTKFMRKAYFVPETKSCLTLFNEMREKRLHMAIIVDEYGGTSGLVTMEDLLESIVGNIQDEYDNEEEEIIEVSDNVFTIDGATLIDEVEDMLDISLPEGDYDTIAGLLTDRLGRIPAAGETPEVTVADVDFTVTEVDETRIIRVRAVKSAEPESEKTVQK